MRSIRLPTRRTSHRSSSHGSSGLATPHPIGKMMCSRQTVHAAMHNNNISHEYRPSSTFYRRHLHCRWWWCGYTHCTTSPWPYWAATAWKRRRLCPGFTCIVSIIPNNCMIIIIPLELPLISSESPTYMCTRTTLPTCVRGLLTYSLSVLTTQQLLTSSYTHFFAPNPDRAPPLHDHQFMGLLVIVCSHA